MLGLQEVWSVIVTAMFNGCTCSMTCPPALDSKKSSMQLPSLLSLTKLDECDCSMRPWNKQRSECHPEMKAKASSFLVVLVLCRRKYSSLENSRLAPLCNACSRQLRSREQESSQIETRDPDIDKHLTVIESLRVWKQVLSSDCQV
eukprot:6468001-Amphidinium_carterae.1